MILTKEELDTLERVGMYSHTLRQFIALNMRDKMHSLPPYYTMAAVIDESAIMDYINADEFDAGSFLDIAERLKAAILKAAQQLQVM